MKAIYLIDADPEIKSAVDAIVKIGETGAERAKFIQKQLDDMLVKSRADCKPHWDIITQRLKDLGKIPQDGDQIPLQFDHKNNIIFDSTQDHSTIEGFIKGLIQ